MWEEDLLPEEGNISNKSHNSNNTSFDENYYDDFVVVDRPDIQKYNKTEKLEEEEKIKDSGGSMLLVARSHFESKEDSKSSHVSLEDF